ncbi:DUF1203 domain-containing protein [Phenylobacterium sp.]|uniref:DUF1203 domain-containing protein n=1 Tax=Phenylobacterium sp. TaxID=1871053 RepID=UPI0019C33766|nr:DUF1203 domain-containing protein [Phenylobacterium sp.]MBC7166840.1 DUF1203 domain-containing protein [Phenylobacterium sp.]
MAYLVRGLDSRLFQPLFGLSDAELTARGVVRQEVDAPVGYPCRISLADAPAGATVLLLNHVHQPADTPYRASHAIFVQEGVTETAEVRDEIPPVLSRRPFISLRAFDARGMMVDADLCPGADLDAPVRRLLGLPGVACLQAHFAARGCYAARIERA